MASAYRMRTVIPICLFVCVIGLHGPGGATAQAQTPSDSEFWNSAPDSEVGPASGIELMGESPAASTDVTLAAPEGVDVPNAPQALPALTDIGQEMAQLQNEWAKFKSDAAKVKYPNVQINGFFQADTGYSNQSANNRATYGDIQDGADFRRLRLSAKGSVAENVNYFVQMDFGFFGRPTFTDVWMEMTKLPIVGNVRVGQWKQPNGLETVTSVRYQTFMERSSLFQTFEAFRHIGIGTYNNADDEMSTWALSVFRTGNDQFGGDIGDNGGLSQAGRYTHLLWYEEGADGWRDYLHLGSSFWHGDPGNDRTRYATIPEMFIGSFGVPAGGAVGTSKVPVPSVANGTPPFVDTGTFAVNNFTHLAGELLYVRGPFSIQSEGMYAIVNPQNNLAQMHYKGAYMFASYFLTGESRTYDRKVGAIDRIKPLEDFKSGCGIGAWEVAARVSYIDLNDGDINGGRMTDFTAGLNWYLNPYTKFQFNYIKSNVNNPVFGKSFADLFGARVQVDF